MQAAAKAAVQASDTSVAASAAAAASHTAAAASGMTVLAPPLSESDSLHAQEFPY